MRGFNIKTVFAGFTLSKLFDIKSSSELELSNKYKTKGIQCFFQMSLFFFRANVLNVLSWSRGLYNYPPCGASYVMRGLRDNKEVMSCPVPITNLACESMLELVQDEYCPSAGLCVDVIV